MSPEAEKIKGIFLRWITPSLLAFIAYLLSSMYTEMRNSITQVMKQQQKIINKLVVMEERQSFQNSEFRRLEAEVEYLKK